MKKNEIEEEKEEKQKNYIILGQVIKIKFTNVTNLIPHCNILVYFLLWYTIQEVKQ